MADDEAEGQEEDAALGVPVFVAPPRHIVADGAVAAGGRAEPDQGEEEARAAVTRRQRAHLRPPLLLIGRRSAYVRPRSVRNVKSVRACVLLCLLILLRPCTPVSCSCSAPASVYVQLCV